MPDDQQPVRNDQADDAKGAADERFQAPAISLPKGGGAIKGIDEKFAVNPATGTGSKTRT